MTNLDIAIELQRAIIAGLRVKVADAEEELDDAEAELYSAIRDLYHLEKREEAQ